MYDKLLAFLFGIQSHIEADIIWHWGKSNLTSSEQGFLQSMSHIASYCLDDWNTGSQKPNCHSIGDTGADFYLSNKGSLDTVGDVWKIPTKDLSNIYTLINRT